MTKQNKVLHISTECYPAAKAGGMADVVGSLPVYQKKFGWSPSVITPMYKLPWFEKNSFRKCHSGSFKMEGRGYFYDIFKVQKDTLPFEYYCVHIPELFERPSIYLNENGIGFDDEPERNVGLQRAVLDWLVNGGIKFEMLHCHDHQTGFIPFLIKKCDQYESISKTPVFYTIHNGAYNSRYPWYRRDLLPLYASKYNQNIDWDGHMDAVAAAMRYADHVNTVSPSYLEECKDHLPPLQYAASANPERFSGILNGIDAEVWDPKTDPLIETRFTKSWDQFKKGNKQSILSGLYQVDGIPLISFIGRFAHQKGGDLLVPAIERILAKFGFVNFFILGSGDKFIETKVQELRDRFSERVAVYIGYNEALAHKVYASSDFIIMPSRFEPCGLNQMFGMRYGSLVIAKKTGGLKDTVIDYGEGGEGISFSYDSVDDVVLAMSRALYLYKDTKKFKDLRSIVVKKDFSWDNSAKSYCDIYNLLISEA